ncbi:lamin tail domain-containing protein [Polyangium sorediatum]|uniref:Lamin tail domain-containing protein n=1 Tax=Polyangium sorediatum TaxID=889274 RepID=A0ABT6NY16_9BACT|nr:lamin tail domain-containing protein [Polyangium sorediatum]MDI1433236.1 lamin tail domain-containing protein [Polyangium sorediatum]
MARMEFFLAGVFVAATAALGCSEASEDRPPTGSASSSAGQGGGGSGGSGGSGQGGGGAGGAGAAKVVINEIAATGEEWIELVNVGDAVMDLDGYGVADQDGDAPKLAEAVRFEAGTKLAPGSYLVIVAGLDAPEAGPQAECLAEGGPATCYQAGFGISASKGDKIFLLSPSDAIVEEAAYPAEAVAEGQTFGRVPNGIGDFEACEPTPGAANTKAP